jgi:hypothetical protein
MGGGVTAEHEERIAKPDEQMAAEREGNRLRAKLVCWGLGAAKRKSLKKVGRIPLI